MAEPIFDSGGKAVAWLNEDLIHDLDGIVVAFVLKTSVYGCAGRHLGFFASGFFRDLRGSAVAFVQGARGGPLLPHLRLSSGPPRFEPPPIRPIPQIPSIPAMPSLTWSELAWDDFLSPPSATRGG